MNFFVEIREYFLFCFNAHRETMVTIKIEDGPAIKPSLHKFMFPSVRMIMHVGFYLHLHLYFEIDFCLGYFTRDRTDFMNLS